jgi:spore germination protein YaaH
MVVDVRRAVISVLGFTMLASLAVAEPATSVSAATNPPRRIVSAWLPYWSLPTSTASVVANKDLFTDASPFWFTASSATTITAQADIPTRLDITGQLHAAGLPVYPTVTDSMPAHGMAGVLANATTRAQHVSALVSTVITGGYDGIDLDYEKFAFSDGSASWTTTRPAWVAFVQQLSAALHARGKRLSVTTPYLTSATTGYWVYDWAHIGPYVDRLRVMTYNYSTSKAGPIAPISWVTSVAAYAVTAVPASKVWIGVPTYGYDWPSTTVGCPVDKLPTRNSLTSSAAIALAASLNITPTWNATYDERTFSYPKTYTGHSATGAAASCTITRTVWYGDRSSVVLRAHLVGTYHLGGIVLWTAGGEDPGSWAYLRSYAQTISPDASYTRMSVVPRSVAYGSYVRIYGTVTRGAGGTAIAGAAVQLQAQRVGSTVWQVMASAAAADDGTVLFRHVPGGPTNYRLVTVAAYDHTASVTGVQSVAVTRSVTLVPQASQVVHGSTIRYSGVVSPSGNGIRVYVQRWTGTAYVTTGSVVAGTGGAFYFPVSAPVPGTYSYRVFVYGDATYGAFTTGRVSVVAT